jgi:photosystem II stability/assembly factor-like uncharacterized protein
VTRSFRAVLAVGVAAVALSLPALAAADTTANPAASGLQWRGIGPFRGGRAVSVTGVPGQPNTFYMGAAGGGVWRTVDAGQRWTPILDDAGTGSIGAVAVSPSNPDVIYVGTGEGALRGDMTNGMGVFKSADGGKSWAHVGLTDTRQIGTIIVDPNNPQIALVAAIGHAFGPNTERGVFRTTDGGASWTKVLYKDENTGAIDVTFDPHDSKIVWAALWTVRRQPWNFSSGGPGSGLYRSSDGGVTWAHVTGNGLPAGILGRIDIQVSGADSNRVYAMIEAKDGGLFRSDDAGVHWARVSQDGRIRQRAWYFSKIYADPKAVDTVYALNTGMLRSTDGGKTFNLVSATHGDHHALWINPNDPRILVNANDGGGSVSMDGGSTWSTQENQPTGSFYHVATDMRFPYWVYGAQQDNSNLAVASFDDEGVIGDKDWYQAGGGESGFVVPDPRDPQIIYSDAENQFGRFDRRDMQVRDISPDPIDNSGHPASELTHRFNWTSPLMLSPHDPDTIYAASEVVWKSTDHGNSWTIVSPDLTRDDKSKQTPSGGPLTKDITSVEYYDTIFALAESPLAKGKLWAGSDDGLVHLTNDGGGHWADVTPKGVPAWSSIDMIEPSPHDAARAYIAVDRHKLDDIAPYAWKTTDDGRSWTSIAAGLPTGAVVHAVREDPVRPGLLYAGTELGVFVSFDDGGSWQRLGRGLPAAAVHDIVVKGDDLVAATHGRSFWILTDLTPLRQSAAPSGAALLYPPQTAVRLYYPDQIDSRRPVGQNPPAGALIDYTLASAPTGEVTVDISDAQGRQVRHLSSTKTAKEIQPPEWPDQIVPNDLIPAKKGFNRLVWDLRMDDPAQIPGAFYSGSTPRGPIVAPGVYQVRLTADGVTLTQPLTIIADPRDGPNAGPGIAAKTALAIATAADIDALHKAVVAIREARKTADPARAARLDAMEASLMQVEMKGSEANLAFPGELNEQYASFAGTLEDADTPPTVQQQALFDDLHARLMARLAAWKAMQG